MMNGEFPVIDNKKSYANLSILNDTRFHTKFHQNFKYIRSKY